MASEFNSNGRQCDGVGCQATTGLTYYEEDNKTLCDECARKVTKDKLQWICKKHDRPISEYCKTHEVGVCHVCAEIEHNEMPCERQDMADVIAEMIQRLMKLQITVREKTAEWRRYGDKIRLCGDAADRLLESIKDHIDDLINDALMKENDNQQCEAAIIDKEVDDETQEMKEKRVARLKQYQEDASKRRQRIEDKQHELHGDLTTIGNITQAKIRELENQAGDVIHAMNDAVQRIDNLILDDEELVNGAQHVIASLTDILAQTVDEGVVEHITFALKGVRFIRGVGNEAYNGMIERGRGKWEIEDSVNVQHQIKEPIIVGIIGDDDVIVTDWQSKHTYVINLRNKTTRMVIQSNGILCVRSCVLLDEDTIVCGKHRDSGCTGNSLRDCVSLYDRQWTLIKDITIPKNTKNIPIVNVFVNKDRMIIATEVGQFDAYVINPADGRIVHTIMCDTGIKMFGVLSTGDIIARPSQVNRKLLIIDGLGSQTGITQSETILNCGIDPLTDELYPVYEDAARKDEDAARKPKVYVISHLSRTGDMKTRDIMTSPLIVDEYRLFLISRIMITSSGKLILCNGKDCVVYRKLINI